MGFRGSERLVRKEVPGLVRKTTTRESAEEVQSVKGSGVLTKGRGRDVSCSEVRTVLHR